MDFKDVAAGNMLLLKAQVPGGLLVLGDLHAVQGDGEMLGLAAECAGEVRLKVTKDTTYKPVRGHRILDIGCAAGRASIALAREGHDVVGIDVAGRLIEAAREAAKKWEIEAAFQVCDPLRLAFSDGAFDAGLLLKTYCYVPKRGNRIAWLGEIARAIRPGCWLFLSQYVIDDVLGSYEPVRKENQERFPELCGRLEEGDGFSLPSEESQTVGYVHYFMEEDLLDELKASPFRLEDTFREGTICYCSLRLP